MLSYQHRFRIVRRLLERVHMECGDCSNAWVPPWNSSTYRTIPCSGQYQWSSPRNTAPKKQSYTDLIPSEDPAGKNETTAWTDRCGKGTRIRLE